MHTMLAAAVRRPYRAVGGFPHTRDQRPRSAGFEIHFIVDSFEERFMHRIRHRVEHPPVGRGLFGFPAVQDGRQGIAMLFLLD